MILNTIHFKYCKNNEGYSFIQKQEGSSFAGKINNYPEQDYPSSLLQNT